MAGITVSHLSFTYPQETVPALRDVSFSVASRSGCARTSPFLPCGLTTRAMFLYWDLKARIFN